jgi:hypothetical protein
MNPADLTTTRERLGMTKAELAHELRVGWQTVHRWELPVDHPENRPIPGIAQALLERLLKEMTYDAHVQAWRLWVRRRLGISGAKRPDSYYEESHRLAEAQKLKR